MGLVAEKHIFFEPFYELITARKPDGSTATYYFNIATILEEYYRKYPWRNNSQSAENPSQTPFLSFDNVTLNRFNGFMSHSQVGGTAFLPAGETGSLPVADTFSVEHWQ